VHLLLRFFERLAVELLDIDELAARIFRPEPCPLTAFTNIPDMAALSFPWLPVRLMLRTRFDNLAKLSRVRAPVLVIHGRHDEIVPFAMGERLFERAAEPKRSLWLERAGHNDVFYAEGELVINALRRFMTAPL
jgi:uncharacterized protein